MKFSIKQKHKSSLTVKLKRSMAGILAITMLSGIMTVLPSMEAGAALATELQDTGAYPDTAENSTIKYEWKLSGDRGEPTKQSWRFDIIGKNNGTGGSPTAYSTTYSSFGNPLYIAMPKTDDLSGVSWVAGTAGLPQIDQTTINYEPTVLVGDYYIAKMGQRKSKLDGNNDANVDNNQLLGTESAANEAVETTTFGSGSGKRTLETKVTTSIQGNYVIVDYYFYGRGNLPSSGQDFLVGMAYDLQINDPSANLKKVIYKMDRGFIARRYGPAISGNLGATRANNMTSLNIILNDPSLGIVDEPTTMWMGNSGVRMQNLFSSTNQTAAIPYSSPNYTDWSGGDYSAAHSWRIRIKPFETVHRRIAFSYAELGLYVLNMGESNYVSNHSGNISTSGRASDAFIGSFDKPHPTIERSLAMAKGRNTTIYLHNNQTISRPIPIRADNRNIVITGSNMELSRLGAGSAMTVPYYGRTYTPSGTNPPVVIKRATGYTGPLFVFDQPNANITFENIILDGGLDKTSNVLGGKTEAALSAAGETIYQTGNEAAYVNPSLTDQKLVASSNSQRGPLIDLRAGKLTLGPGTVLRNNFGGAINVTNTAELNIEGRVTEPQNPVTITGNVGGTFTDGKTIGAVNVEAGAKLNLRGLVKIQDNYAINKPETAADWPGESTVGTETTELYTREKPTAGKNYRPLNLYLEDGAVAKVYSNLRDSKIGVTTENSIGDTAATAAEIPVAEAVRTEFDANNDGKAEASYAYDEPPFLGNFISDLQMGKAEDSELTAANIGNIYTISAASAAADKATKAVLGAKLYMIKFAAKDHEGNDRSVAAFPAGFVDTVTDHAGAKFSVASPKENTSPNVFSRPSTSSAPAYPKYPAIQGSADFIGRLQAPLESFTTGGVEYVARELRIIADNPSMIPVGTVQGDTVVYKKLEYTGGILPAANLTLTYVYYPKNTTVSFRGNGGTPSLITRNGTIGDFVPAAGFSALTRFGYRFGGWIQDTNDNHILGDTVHVTDSHGVTTPVADRILKLHDPLSPSADDILFETATPEKPYLGTLYAKWIPDEDVRSALTVQYQNADSGIIFGSISPQFIHSVHGGVTGFPIDYPVELGRMSIPGYVWANDASSYNPSSLKKEAISSANPAPDAAEFIVGGADDGKLAFAMPQQDVMVRYGYRVGTDQYMLRVEHVMDGSGLPVSGITDFTGQYFPEERAEYTAPNPSGLRIKEVGGIKQVMMTAGDTQTGTLEGGNYRYGARDFTVDADGNFSVNMPNQDVTVKIIYEYDGSNMPYSVRFTDNGALDTNLQTPQVQGANVLAPVNTTHAVGDAFTEIYPNPYGYLYESHTADPAFAVIHQANHDLSVNMPIGGLEIVYKLDRDANFWKTITYKAGMHGSIAHSKTENNITEHASADLLAVGADFKADVLINDASAQGMDAAYTFAEIKDKKLIPYPTADHTYLFEGWFEDTDLDGLRNPYEPLILDVDTFSAEKTLTASFVEDSSWWGDIYFVPGPNGSIDISQPTSRHITKDKLWGDIVKPIPTPDNYFVRDTWYLDDVQMTDAMPIELGRTYMHKFVKDPVVFGIPVHAPDASGTISPDSGKGRVTAHNTQVGYTYVLTDIQGNIIDSAPGDATLRHHFDGLSPETRYRIYEVAGNPSIVAGSPITSVAGAAGPSEVLVPAVGGNYDIDYDTENDGMTALTIAPADIDADYALLDEQGNVVLAPEAGADGWQSGSAGRIRFSNLLYNHKYTVVARVRGANDSPVSRRADGTRIVTDPGGEIELPKFILQTQRGKITSVAGNIMDSTEYREVKAGDTVTISADAAGFRYWKVTAGELPAAPSRINSREYQFIMPSTNVVLSAYYSSIATPSNALVEGELRGGSAGEIAIDPMAMEELSDTFTTQEDRDLYALGSEITYKIVYDKNTVKDAEHELIRAEEPFISHPTAYTGAWGMDIRIERYVNGRRVDRVLSSAVRAQLIHTFVQLKAEDVDMTDYRLYQIKPDGFGGILLHLVDMSEDPEQSGGLFTFEGNAGGRYVLAYAKTFKQKFVYTKNNRIESMKVRRGEMLSDYTEYASLLPATAQFFDAATGYEQSLLGWSKAENVYRGIDPTEAVIRKQTYYTYYQNNAEEFDRLRDELERAIADALNLSRDYFLRSNEAVELDTYIRRAAAVLDQRAPRASASELLAALEALRNDIRPYQDALNVRYGNYNQNTVIQSNGSSSSARSGGGTFSGTAGKGEGTIKAPYYPGNVLTYHVGQNGTWEQNSSGKWQFKLNGGIPVTSMWAWLEYDSGSAQKTGWYHFNGNSTMDYGWFKDERGDWYYCNYEHDGFFGKMKTGWHKDPSDSYSYYLDASTGKMAVGWTQIDGKWYYFSPDPSEPTYSYNPQIGTWEFVNSKVRPLGSMYTNTQTPDGYTVGADGAWIP